MRKKTTYHLLLILEGCRKQQRLSQLKLYEHYYSYGMGICLRFSQSREEAQEILNDGFLKVFKKIHQFDPQKPFEPWLRKVLIRTAIDYYRKFHKANAPQSTAYDDAWAASVPNDAISQLAYDDLIKYLQHLPPSYRMVFNLFAVEGMSHPEIAKELGIGVGTSKSNLAKARMKLKQMMNPSYNHTNTDGNGK